MSYFGGVTSEEYLKHHPVTVTGIVPANVMDITPVSVPAITEDLPSEGVTAPVTITANLTPSDTLIQNIAADHGVTIEEATAQIQTLAQQNNLTTVEVIAQLTEQSTAQVNQQVSPSLSAQTPAFSWQLVVIAVLVLFTFSRR